MKCNGKTKHKSFNAAMIESKKMKNKKGLKAKAYKCNKCGFWHIGKPSFLCDESTFWENIHAQMSTHDLLILGIK